MNNPLKIALLLQAGRGWLGGVEYIKNLILALDSLPDEVRSTFEVHLITSSDSLDDDMHHRWASPSPLFAIMLDTKNVRSSLKWPKS